MNSEMEPNEMNNPDRVMESQIKYHQLTLQGEPIQKRNESNYLVRPFLKWAGGKNQLLEQIDRYLPKELKSGIISKYFEPFIGGGALLFFIGSKYSITVSQSLPEYNINDINEEIILAYKTIQKSPEGLISELDKLQSNYLVSKENDRKKMFYDMRNEFNDKRRHIDFSTYSENWIERTAQIIFLNKTCFNGLFRVNKKGEFNVPFGKYKNPRILDDDNLRKVSKLLKRTQINCGDFKSFTDVIDHNSFVYFDPPYRPLNQTSSFTSYSTNSFEDDEQIRLCNYFKILDEKGAKLMLSNSDPKNIDSEDNFFDDYYRDFNIYRVPARRAINANGNRRGEINELIITNY